MTLKNAIIRTNLSFYSLHQTGHVTNEMAVLARQRSVFGSQVWYRKTGSPCLLRDRVYFFCLGLVGAYFENAASQQYVDTNGSRAFTSNRNQNSTTVANLIDYFRFLSAAKSVSCLSSLCGRSWVGPSVALDRCGKSRPYRDSIPRPSSP